MFLVNKVVDKAIDKAIDVGFDKIDKMLEENKLKQILKKSIEYYISLEKIKNFNSEQSSIIINKDKIQGLEISLIKPNLSVEKLEYNLKDFFSECIIVDDEYKAKNISRFICCEYKSCVADFITLNQVDEDIHELKKLMCNGKEEIVDKLDKTENRIKEMSENVRRINSYLHSDGQYPIIFLDELDNSKVFCYISMRIMVNIDDIDEELLDEIGSNVYSETNVYIDECGFTNVDFNFFEPIIQSEMREILKYINDKFSQENISIISVSTHA